MVNTSLKRRRTEEQLRGKVPKKEKRKVKKQKHYHSSSDEEGGARDAPVRGSSEEPEEPFQPSGANAAMPGKQELSKQQLRKQAKYELKKLAQQAAAAEDSSASDDDDEEEAPAPVQQAQKPEPKFTASIPAKVPAKSALKKTAPIDPSVPLPDSASEDDLAHDSTPEVDEFNIADSESDVSDASSLSDTSTTAARKVRKRNDPEAFANSISRILGSKLTSTKRSEPILSRSKDAATANRELADSKLTEKARRQVVAERKALADKGRIKDVLGLENPEISTEDTTAKEKDLRRTAQKGVIKLFNAVRAAQVKGEIAERESKSAIGGVVGLDKREERVKEMSKQGFLDMLTGAKGGKEGSVEA